MVGTILSSFVRECSRDWYDSVRPTCAYADVIMGMIISRWKMRHDQDRYDLFSQVM